MTNKVLLFAFAIACVLQSSFGNPATRSARGLDDLTDLTSLYDGPALRVWRDPRGAEKEDSHDFGESIENYPAETIQDLLSETPQLKIFFKRTKVPGFGNRHHSFDQSEDESMCQTSLMTHWPQKLTNRKGLEKFIVNQDNSYQPVYVERCKKDASCTLKEFFPANYKSQCKQKYSVARLVALSSPTDRNLVVDEFDVPCGCVCTIKRI